ncbi:MAG: hypothetical protein QXV17_07530 [Candidatus Micrarchaeaceae archaeon]
MSQALPLKPFNFTFNSNIAYSNGGIYNSSNDTFYYFYTDINYTFHIVTIDSNMNTNDTTTEFQTNSSLGHIQVLNAFFDNLNNLYIQFFALTNFSNDYVLVQLNSNLTYTGNYLNNVNLSEYVAGYYNNNVWGMYNNAPSGTEYLYILSTNSTLSNSNTQNQTQLNITNFDGIITQWAGIINNNFMFDLIQVNNEFQLIVYNMETASFVTYNLTNQELFSTTYIEPDPYIIGVDSSNNIYTYSYYATSSTSPTEQVISKISNSGAVIYSTVMPFSNSSYGIGVGNVYLGSQPLSDGNLLVTTSNFVAILDIGGNILYFNDYSATKGMYILNGCVFKNGNIFVPVSGDGNVFALNSMSSAIVNPIQFKTNILNCYPTINETGETII